MSIISFTLSSSSLRFTVLKGLGDLGLSGALVAIAVLTIIY